jgi:poly(ribitol-phosphate) beta-N-acetylglucosaminyltransferase
MSTSEANGLTVIARTPLSALSTSGIGQLTAHAEGIAAQTRTVHVTDAGTTVAISFRVTDLLHGSALTGQRRTFLVETGPAPGLARTANTVASARASSLARTTPLVRRRGTRLYVITAARTTQVAS